MRQQFRRPLGRSAGRLARGWRLLAAGLATAAGLTVGAGCGAKEDPSPNLPNPPVNVQLVLSNYQYRALRFDGGALYVPGGSRGLIVYRRDATTYHAFERLCPYQPQTHCAKVSLDPSRLFLRDSCCTTQWNMAGEAIGGPGARPLLQYTTSLSGGTLYIIN